MIRIRANSQNAPRVRFAVWNARSVKAKNKKRNKTAALCDFIINHQIDVMAITETWYKGDHRDDRSIADFKNTLPNYDLYHVPRQQSKKGGGVAILARHGLIVKQNNILGSYNSFEHMDLHISSMAGASLRLVVIYRPPPNKKNKFTVPEFHDEFSSMLDSVLPVTTPFVIAGDFNVHVDQPQDSVASSFLDMLNDYDLEQHVCVATHVDGHTLDLLVTRKTDNVVSSVSVHNDLPSDHGAVKSFLDIARPAASRKHICSRKLREVNIESFRKNIKSSTLNSSQPTDTATDLSTKFVTVLHKIIDNHAPVTARTVVLRPHAPWYCDSLREAKREKRRCERKYMATDLTVHKEIYQEQCKKYNEQLASAKAEFHRKQISDAEDSNLFRIVDKLTKPKSEGTLPTHEDPKELADGFAGYFNRKVNTLRARLDEQST